MGMFSTRQPRKFRRVSIYTDERKEKLQKLVEQTMRVKDGAMPEDKAYDVNKFQGTFINFTPRAQRYKEKGTRIAWPLAVILIVVLLIIWKFIMTGTR